MTISELFGQRLSYIRKQKGISQEELAERANLSRQYISRIESGKSTPTLDTLKALSVALNVSLVELLENL